VSGLKKSTDPFMQGCAAFRAGDPIRSNPYRGGNKSKCARWRAGWTKTAMRASLKKEPGK